MALDDLTAGLLDLRKVAADVRWSAYGRCDAKAAKAARKVTSDVDGLLGVIASHEGGGTRRADQATVLKASPEDRYLMCVVYSAHRLPKRGADGRVDVASPAVLEKACWKFAENGFRVGVGHQPGGEMAAQVVENWVHRGPKWTLTAPDGTTQVVRKGDWLCGLILSPAAWADYKAGRFGGVSLQGRAGRRPPRPKTLARQRRN